MKVYKTYSNISPPPIKSALPARQREAAIREGEDEIYAFFTTNINIPIACGQLY